MVGKSRIICATDLTGVTKSICWVAWNNENDCLRRIGVKNHKGKIIIISKTATIIPAVIFCDFMYLLVKSYTGVKINAKIMPTIIEIKTGLRTNIAKIVK